MRRPYDAMHWVEGGAAEVEVYGALDKNKHKKTQAIIPNLAKFVRLIFHDCVKEASGVGCNGCVNFEGMGDKFTMEACAKRTNPEACDDVDGGIHPQSGPLATNNNNLLWTMKVLEEIYTNPRAGEGQISMHFDQSLFDAGKSRADLWAFASLVALQKSVENNNVECNPKKQAPCLNHVDENSPDCSIDLPVLEFKSGRSDCVPDCSGDHDFPFCTTAEEIHPNQHGNGTDTVNFFADNFDLTPRESVALMGVHTLGHPEEVNSMFRHYPWTPQGREEFNNQYFINIVNTTNYLYRKPIDLLTKDFDTKECNLPISAFIGDEYGNPFPVGYKVRSEKRTNAFGPWDWALHGNPCSEYVCHQIAASGASYTLNSCCHWIDSEVCQRREKGCPFVRVDNLIDCGGPRQPACEPYSNFQHTSMFNVDMGLNLKFETNEDGRPVGCPGMTQDWINNKHALSEIVECELNDEPADADHTMAEMVELFARDNDAWVKEFTQVYGKMMENGVEKGDLEVASSAWMDAVCIDKKGSCRF